MALRMTTAGESHGPGLTTIVEGLPAGLELDRETLESANYISEVDADLLAGSIAGEDGAAGAGSVEVLRRRLPARGR